MRANFGASPALICPVVGISEELTYEQFIFVFVRSCSAFTLVSESGILNVFVPK